MSDHRSARNPAAEGPVLTVQGLDAGYGDLQVLYDVHLEVQAGERVLVFGPNGAGKSTLMKAIFGLVRPCGGASNSGARRSAPCHRSKSWPWG